MKKNDRHDGTREFLYNEKHWRIGFQQGQNRHTNMNQHKDQYETSYPGIEENSEYHVCFVFTCNNCDLECKNENSLKLHIRQMHANNSNNLHNTSNKDLPPMYKVCGHVSKNLKIHEKHIRLEHYGSKFLCSICQCCMATQENLERHIKRHNTKNKVPCSKLFTCKVCDKTFKEKKNLQLHMVVHTMAHQVPLTCDICKKSFNNKLNLWRHIQAHEMGSTPDKSCVICNKKFRNNYNLRRHLEIHPINKYQFTKTNNILFNIMNNIQNPVQAHTGILAHEYQLTGTNSNKMINEANNMQDPMEVHSKKRQFACPTCNKMFETMAKLRRHMEVHPINKPFIQENNVQVYTTIPGKQERFTCLTYNGEFNTKSCVKKHMQVHPIQKVRSLPTFTDTAWDIKTDIEEEEIFEIYSDYPIYDGCSMEFGQMKLELNEVKLEPGEIKLEASEIKSETSEIRLEASEIKSEPSEIKSEVIEIKLEASEIKSEPSEIRLETGDMEEIYCE